MAAEDHLSPRLFHSTDADLSPGDLIQPGYRRPGQDNGHYSDDYAYAGHGDFAWASANRPKTHFGTKHYEVEPTGLAHPYELHETPGGLATRSDSPGAEKRRVNGNSLHARNWVSLAPLRVKQRVKKSGEPWGTRAT